MSRRTLLLVATVAALAVVLVSVAQAPAGGARRTIYMSATEYHGGANVADEPWPPAAVEGTKELSPLGGGYELEEPDETGRWEVESYRFEPGFVAASLGERLRLEIVGINGARHDSHLISPSGEMTPLVVTRGRLTRVLFLADEVGIWKLICDTHPPGMVAEILVLP